MLIRLLVASELDLSKQGEEEKKGEKKEEKKSKHLQERERKCIRIVLAHLDLYMYCLYA